MVTFLLQRNSSEEFPFKAAAAGHLGVLTLSSELCPPSVLLYLTWTPVTVGLSSLVPFLQELYLCSAFLSNVGRGLLRVFH